VAVLAAQHAAVAAALAAIKLQQAMP